MLRVERSTEPIGVQLAPDALFPGDAHERLQKLCGIAYLTVAIFNGLSEIFGQSHAAGVPVG
jgi:hypothetical protein